MAAVTAGAVLVLRLLVQTGQLGNRMAGRACGSDRDAGRPVRAVTIHAAGRQLAVRGGGFLGVACHALDARRRTGVRLMTIRAQLMAPGRAREFAHMTTLALGDDTARVRLVTAGTRLMSRTRIAASIRVTDHASGADSTGFVRQPLMATLARGVTDPRGRQGQLPLMAALTGRVLSERDLEVVRGVTALTRGSRVKIAIGGGETMAAAARPCDDLCLFVGRVRFVASHARPEPEAVRVVRVHVRMALHARAAGVGAHVVRRVTTAASRMFGHARCSQHHLTGMAGAAVRSPRALKSMRLMTIHARAMPARKQRTGRHDGLRLTVAFDARGERTSGRCVLVRVAGGAHAVW